jgi:hypothetical protein
MAADFDIACTYGICLGRPTSVSQSAEKLSSLTGAFGIRTIAGEEG